MLFSKLNNHKFLHTQATRTKTNSRIFKIQFLPQSMFTNLLCISSLLIFLTGITNANIGLVFCGGLFLFAILISFIILLVAISLLRYTIPETSIPFSLKAIHELSDSNFVLIPHNTIPSFYKAIDIRLKKLSFICYSIERNYVSQFFESIKVKISIEENTHFNFSKNALSFGKFESKKIFLRVQDFFSLIQISLVFPESDTFFVYPEKTKLQRDTVIQQSSDSPIIQTHFTRSDEGMDSRPYIVGDDIRKLNWKQYAHSGNLFTRLGELIPTGYSRSTLIIDTPIIYSLSYKNTVLYYTQYAEKLHGFIFQENTKTRFKIFSLLTNTYLSNEADILCSLSSLNPLTFTAFNEKQAKILSSDLKTITFFSLIDINLSHLEERFANINHYLFTEDKNIDLIFIYPYSNTIPAYSEKHINKAKEQILKTFSKRNNIHVSFL